MIGGGGGTECWSIGVLECWRAGVLEYWSIGVLEYWSTGVLEYWSIGVHSEERSRVDMLFPAKFLNSDS
jgi:hypothetical protein